MSIPEPTNLREILAYCRYDYDVLGPLAVDQALERIAKLLGLDTTGDDCDYYDGCDRGADCCIHRAATPLPEEHA